MQISPDQHRRLQKLQHYRQAPPTIPGFLRDGWRAYLYVSVVGLVGFGYFLWFGWQFASGLFAGMVLATVVRDLGWYRRIARAWPLQAEITNWQRVEQLLNPPPFASDQAGTP